MIIRNEAGQQVQHTWRCRPEGSNASDTPFSLRTRRETNSNLSWQAFCWVRTQEHVRILANCERNRPATDEWAAIPPIETPPYKESFNRFRLTELLLCTYLKTAYPASLILGELILEQKQEHVEGIKYLHTWFLCA